MVLQPGHLTFFPAAVSGTRSCLAQVGQVNRILVGSAKGVPEHVPEHQNSLQANLAQLPISNSQTCSVMQ